MSQGTN